MELSCLSDKIVSCSSYNAEWPSSCCDPPFQVVIDPQSCLMLLSGVLELDATGEPQLVLPQAQFFECLFRRDQAEALPRQKTKQGLC